MAKQDIEKCVGCTEDVFFDSVDFFSAEDLGVDKGLCEIWRNQLRSVKERRDTFLREMGFMEESISCPSIGIDDVGLNRLGMEKMLETSEEASSSSCSSISCEDENVVFNSSECSGSNTVVDEHWENDQPIRHSVDSCEGDSDPSTSSSIYRDDKSLSKRVGQWWKEMHKRSGISRRRTCKVENGVSKKSEMRRKKVHVNRKKVKELSALFEAQEIRAHKGMIWTMKFSPDGQYLASGGEDGVVRVWQVNSIDSSYNKLSNVSRIRSDEKAGFGKEKKRKIPIVIPSKMFQIEEKPLQEFYGHTGEVLDLAWSSSNFLLSSSMDKTVRLWRVGSDTCLSTFLHTDYVTCVQFNPRDDRYFISGSIDGKVRMWGVLKRRVLDWADIRDAVTALCYQRDGNGFAVGSLSGICRFYETKDGPVELSAQILIHSSKKSSTNRITGLQFLSDESQRVMVMSEDSKLRILDQGDIICKYRGLCKSGGQMSASFTSDKRHIVSIGDGSRVYLWNHEEPSLVSSRHKKSVRSCEHFFSEGVSVAIPWSGTETRSVVSPNLSTESKTHNPLSFSLRNMFSSKSSAVWPEDVLPICISSEEAGDGPYKEATSSAWGLVIVTANCDGFIRTFHNYGLPTEQ